MGLGVERRSYPAFSQKVRVNIISVAAVHVCVLPQSNFQKAVLSCKLRRSRLMQRNSLTFQV